MIAVLKRIWLVASREYRATAKTRSFRLTILSVPVTILILTLVQSGIKAPTGAAYLIVDRTNFYSQNIDDQVDLSYERDVLVQLSEYVQRWHLDIYVPGAIWNGGRRWFDENEVKTFVASGGAEAALARFKSHTPSSAPDFEFPAREFYRVSAPEGLNAIEKADVFGQTVQPYLHNNVMTSQGQRPLSTVIFIPKTFGASEPDLYIWTNGRPNDRLLNTVRTEITNVLRSEALVAKGLKPTQANQIQHTDPRFRVTAPPPGKGRDGVLIRSALPIALTYLLLMSIITVGTKMLLSVVEERSNKLMESILACISPEELMYGKLLGVIAIGLTTVAVWAGCVVIVAYTMHGQLADFLLPALSALDSPWVLVSLVVYFISGYVMTAMILLAIGSSSNSMQDAQGYLQPIIMFIIIPYALMVTTMLQDPDSAVPKILSWIPLFTPYAMLARIGTGVSIYEIVGTTLVMFAFMAIELIFLGRLFRANILNTGQTRKFGKVLKRLTGMGDLWRSDRFRQR